MPTATNSKSIFSQQLDRAVFVAYFLGAVVPLLAFGFAVQRYVLPSMQEDSTFLVGALGITCGISVLSLTSFLALRRLTHNAVARMKADNSRLMSILSVTQELSVSMHVQAVAEIAATGARQMTDSEASYLLSRDSLDKPLSIAAHSGQNAQKLFQAHEQKLVELAENSLVTGLLESECFGPESSLQSSPNSEQTLTAAVALPLIAEGNANSSLVIVDVAPDRRFGTEERDALTTLAGLTSVALHNADLQDSQRNFFTHITETLVLAMDAHVDGRKGHAHAVARLANRLGRELELPDDRMQTLHFAALLHDIGMLKIPAGSQRSPGHFQKHPVIGHRLLSRIRLWEEVAPIVLHHHEWFDGAGYPEGRVGRAIPIESRIISVADCFDCMLRDESHRLAMSLEEALAEIRRGAGKQFDPDVVVALAKLAERGELGVESP